MCPQTESPGPSSAAERAGPAVVYFAKAPLPGQVKTRLCPPLSEDEAAALYGAFLRRVVRAVPGARTLVYGWPGEQLELLAAALPAGWRKAGIELRAQQGADLWQRMQHCYAELLGAGHRPVLIRNTDSPDLDPELIGEAIRRAGLGKVVLGPDHGGGYYLMALSEAHPELFCAASGGAETVFAQTIARIEGLGLELVELARQGDVDTFDDLLAMWRAR